jgi:hypothetical protein
MTAVLKPPPLSTKPPLQGHRGSNMQRNRAPVSTVPITLATPMSRAAAGATPNAEVANSDPVSPSVTTRPSASVNNDRWDRSRRASALSTALARSAPPVVRTDREHSPRIRPQLLPSASQELDPDREQWRLMRDQPWHTVSTTVNGQRAGNYPVWHPRRQRQHRTVGISLLRHDPRALRRHAARRD